VHIPEELMKRAWTIVAASAVVLGGAFAVWSAAPAVAGKPPTIVSTAFTPNGDCSVDFAIEVNARGHMPSVIVVNYWQRGTQNGASYEYLRAIERGTTHTGTVGFAAADPTYGAIYELGYTAFARNGSIMASGLIGWVDAAACI